METRMLKKQTPDYRNKIYIRYMDDSFAVFDNDNACISFSGILNNQHKNIAYMIEKSKNILQFLHVVVQINEKDVDTRVWQKPTNTAVPVS